MTDSYGIQWKTTRSLNVQDILQKYALCRVFGCGIEIEVTEGALESTLPASGRGLNCQSGNKNIVSLQIIASIEELT